MGADDTARLYVVQAAIDGPVESLAFLGVKVVAPSSENLVHRHELHDLAIGQVGRLVEHDATVRDVSSEGLHENHFSPRGRRWLS